MIKDFLRISTIVLVFSFITAQSRGQSTTKEISEKFFGMYASDPVKAVDYAFTTNKWFAKKTDDLISLKNKLKNLVDLLGNYYGYEVLTEKTAGENIKVVTYIARYDREALRFILIYYRPKDTWQVQNLSFDEDLTGELEEASKIYRLKENLF